MEKRATEDEMGWKAEFEQAVGPGEEQESLSGLQSMESQRVGHDSAAKEENSWRGWETLMWSENLQCVRLTPSALRAGPAGTQA